jgi:hypothetical protein
LGAPQVRRTGRYGVNRVGSGHPGATAGRRCCSWFRRTTIVVKRRPAFRVRPRRRRASLQTAVSIRQAPARANDLTRVQPTGSHLLVRRVHRCPNPGQPDSSQISPVASARSASSACCSTRRRRSRAARCSAVAGSRGAERPPGLIVMLGGRLGLLRSGPLRSAYPP